MHDLKQWDKMVSHWQMAKTAYEAAVHSLDVSMLSHLKGKGAPPSRQKLAAIEELYFRMHEARGAVDQMISEHAS